MVVEMTESRLGAAGEAAVINALTSVGIPCYLPFGEGNTADLIAEIGGKPLKLQVKSCGNATATVTFRLAKRRRLGWRPYTDVDYFALYASHYKKVLLVPWQKGQTSINVRFRNTVKARKTDIAADDIDILKVVEEIEHGVQKPH